MFYLFTNLLALLETSHLWWPAGIFDALSLTGRAATDDSPWVQLIIVAVIIGFSVLKAIARKIKAMAEQKSDQGEYSPAPSRPKKRYVADDSSYKTLEQLREERKAQIRAALGIPEPPDEPPAEPPAVVVEAPQVVEKNEEPAAVTHFPKVKKPPAHFTPPPQEVYAEPAPSKILVKENKAHISSSLPASKAVHELLFSSRQDLRNAILYQEILGKPLALRDII